MNKITISSGSVGSVKFRCDIIDAKTGRTVKRGQEKTNLLFDAGLDRLGAASRWPDLFAYFVLGDGTTPTRRDSGVITFSRSGNVVTSSANFFEAGDAGRLLKFDSGEEMYVTAYNSGTSVNVSVLGALSAAEGTIYYVNRTSLGNELKRTSTLTADSGDHGWSWNGTTGILSTWKTMLFSAEVGTVTYREIGWSHAAAGASLINGAALIAGGGDVLVADQQYKVRVQLDRLVSPRTPSAVSTPDIIAQWTGTAEEQLEIVALSVWSTTGSIGNVTNQGSSGLEPTTGLNIRLDSTSAALNSPSTSGFTPSGSVNLGSMDMTAASYVSGSFYRNYSAVFSPSSGNSTAIRSIRVGGPTADPHFRLLMDGPQTKTSAQKLTLNVLKSWGRVLVN